MSEPDPLAADIAAVDPSRLGRPAALAIGLGMALSLGIVAASVLLAASNARALARAAAAQEARTSLSATLSALEGAETGQRGFLLTGKPAYLRPYELGAAATPGLLDALAGSLATDDAQRAAVARLRALSESKLRELRQTTDLALAGRTTEALEIVQSDQGQRDMEQIRDAAAALDAEQRAALSRQIETVTSGGRLLIAADIAGFALLALLAAGIGWATLRTLRTLRAAQAALRTANDTLEHRVAERTEDLTAANEEIQRFAYIVSHDLRSPLVNIMGFTSELEVAAGALSNFVARSPETDPGSTAAVRAAADEDIPEAIRFIKASTAKMDRLIGAILKLSREGRRALTAEPIDLRAFMLEIADTIRHQADARGAAVSVGPLPAVVADRLVLEQIFANLLDNAVKYLAPGRPGRIEVAGRARGGRVVIEVSDNGRGIADRDRERVFELFRRAGDQSVPGEGIGLAHVRALVRRLGGQIDVRSTEGAGSVFRVEFPAGPPSTGPVSTGPILTGPTLTGPVSTRSA